MSMFYESRPMLGVLHSLIDFHSPFLQRGPVIIPIYKWANRGTENLRKVLRAPRKRLDLNPSLSRYKVLVFSNMPCCIYSTLEQGSGYPAQVGGKKIVGKKPFCEGFYYISSIKGGVYDGQAGGLKLATLFWHLLPTRQALFISCQLMWRVP